MTEKKTVRAFIGMGSNLGDGKSLLEGAWQALGEVDGIVLDGLSSPYTTAPVDMTSQHWFTNAVGRIETSLSPLDLLQVLLQTEVSFGRTRDEKVFGYQDRSLDLDLLYHGEVKMDTPELILPHPRIASRLFVLVPFAELDPEFKETVIGASMENLARRLRESVQDSREQEIIRGSWNE